MAKALKCHSTLVAHILGGKSQMTCEQGIRAARYFELSTAETDYFMTLILWDRAGDKETKVFFDQKLKLMLESRANLGKRWKVNQTLTDEQEHAYYSSWIPMAVHLLTELQDVRTVEEIATRLKLEISKAKAVVSDLLKMGLISKSENNLFPTNTSVHLGKDSNSLQNCHINMRQKAIQEFTNNVTPNGTSYSSFVTLTREDAKAVREMLIRHIEEVRDVVRPSKPEVLYLHSLDFLEIT